MDIFYKEIKYVETVLSHAPAITTPQSLWLLLSRSAGIEGLVMSPLLEECNGTGQAFPKVVMPLLKGDTGRVPSRLPAR